MSGGGLGEPQVKLARRPRPGETLCALDQLDADLGVRRFVWHDHEGAQRIFLLRRGDTVHGYFNLCPHAYVNLDSMPGDLLSADRAHLECSFHGALFRFDDGLCVAGPPKDRRLLPFPVLIEDDAVKVAP